MIINPVLQGSLCYTEIRSRHSHRAKDVLGFTEFD
nr:MAG TPA: hypothetical protein [Caudoviricetes sp.]